MPDSSNCDSENQNASFSQTTVDHLKYSAPSHVGRFFANQTQERHGCHREHVGFHILHMEDINLWDNMYSVFHDPANAFYHKALHHTTSYLN